MVAGSLFEELHTIYQILGKGATALSTQRCPQAFMAIILEDFQTNIPTACKNHLIGIDFDYVDSNRFGCVLRGVMGDGLYLARLNLPGGRPRSTGLRVFISRAGQTLGKTAAGGKSVRLLIAYLQNIPDRDIKVEFHNTPAKAWLTVIGILFPRIVGLIYLVTHADAHKRRWR